MEQETIPNQRKPIKPRLSMASATATMYTRDGKSGNWIVNDEKGKKLWEVSGKLSEQEIMDIIHMARKFEELAFQEGIRYEKEVVSPRDKSNLQAAVRVLKHTNEQLTAHNALLAEALDKHLNTIKN